MIEIISVTLDKFVDGVAHCTLHHFKSTDYLTSTGKPRMRTEKYVVYEGNVRYIPPHHHIDNVHLSFDTVEGAKEFVDTLKV